MVAGGEVLKKDEMAGLGIFGLSTQGERKRTRRAGTRLWSRVAIYGQGWRWTERKARLKRLAMEDGREVEQGTKSWSNGRLLWKIGQASVRRPSWKIGEALVRSRDGAAPRKNGGVRWKGDGRGKARVEAEILVWEKRTQVRERVKGLYLVSWMGSRVFWDEVLGGVADRRSKDPSSLPFSSFYITPVGNEREDMDVMRERCERGSWESDRVESLRRGENVREWVCCAC